MMCDDPAWGARRGCSAGPSKSLPMTEQEEAPGASHLTY